VEEEVLGKSVGESRYEYLVERVRDGQVCQGELF
jgi:hypothetical protein